MDADQVTRATKEVATAPFSTDLMLPDASDSSCVSVPVHMGVGVDTGSWKAGIGPGVLKGLWAIFSNWLRQEGRTRGLGVVTEMGSGVGLEGGVGNSFIHSAAGSSGSVCTVSIRADGAVGSAPNACLSSSSSSLTTCSITVFTETSLGAGDVPAVRVLGEVGSFGPLTPLLPESARMVPVDPIWLVSLS